MSNPNQRIRSEALYVICNAINSECIGTQLLQQLFDQKYSGLVEPLIDALAKDLVDAELTLNILQALIVLLNLDLM